MTRLATLKAVRDVELDRAIDHRSHESEAVPLSGRSNPDRATSQFEGLGPLTRPFYLYLGRGLRN